LLEIDLKHNPNLIPLDSSSIPATNHGILSVLSKAWLVRVPVLSKESVDLLSSELATE
jgi:hypothetical protein